jgi:LuxR family transcriptional regulator, maltose regulon positive regulatory protein
VSAASAALVDVSPLRAVHAVAPSRARRETVWRDRLVRRLSQSADVPVVLLRAPAGYGKTTLLAQWSARDRRPFVWPRDGAGDPFGDGPAVAVLDGPDLDVARARAWAEAIPPGSQLVISTRGEPALPLGSLRAGGRLLELGMAELAMTRREAAALLELAGVGLEPDGLAALLRRTEGWPAGLSLAALSLRGEDDPGARARAFGGDDRLVADYIRDELLAPLPARELDFLMRSSILPRLEAGACDAILGQTGSGTLLRELARGGMPLVPLDHTDDAYRHHPLFREMLQAEQRRRHPLRTTELHRRAGAWLAREGDLEGALEHAVASGELPAAGARLWAIALERTADGRVSEVRWWLGRFRADDRSSHAALALTTATTHLADADRDRIEHWVAKGVRQLDAGQQAAPSARAAAAVLRAFVARDGLAAVVGDAADAYARTAEDDPWRPLACLLRGAGLHLMGEEDRAVPLLEEGARRGSVVAPYAQVLCLAQLALIAADADDWDRAALLASRARAQVERRRGLERYPTAALVFAVSAHVRAHRERVDAAQDDLRRAQARLGGLVDAPPWYEVETRVVLARAALRLGDAAGCREQLAAATQALRAPADAPRAAAWIERCRAQADAFATSAATGPTSLTTAELRVLRMLPTHLSFREMGARLHVTANTVKTHAHAVYRKLDSSSRSEAVVRAQAIGLLDP